MWTENYFDQLWWQQQSSAACPRCRMTLEEKLHICRCTQDKATLKWTEAIVALMLWMKAEQSDPNLIQALTQGLQAWHSGTAPLEATPVFYKQSLLGWDAALDGWLLVEWHAQQETYWLTWQRKKLSKWWMTKLIKKLWNVSWEMWDHCNGILHNSLQPCKDILDSQINKKRWSPSTAMAFKQFPEMCLCSSSNLWRTSYNNQGIIKKNGLHWSKQQWRENGTSMNLELT